MTGYSETYTKLLIGLLSLVKYCWYVLSLNTNFVSVFSFHIFVTLWIPSTFHVAFLFCFEMWISPRGHFFPAFILLLIVVIGNHKRPEQLRKGDWLTRRIPFIQLNKNCVKSWHFGHCNKWIMTRMVIVPIQLICSGYTILLGLETAAC